jgi:glycerol-1-phosphate dehydrogenase [NAD(P)+]
MIRSPLPETIDIGPGAVRRMAAYCVARGVGPVRIVADSSTWKALGAEAEAELKAAGASTRSTIFADRYLAADARSVFRLLVDDNPAERLYLAVGSGTITDLVRFVCHRTGRDFVSLPTAASVDAYASIVAPLNVEGVKRTVPAAAPIAVFADTDCLARSPRSMTAAGFGDILCKFSAIADWRLGALVWNEPFDEALALRSVAAAEACVEAASAIGAARPEGLAVLMSALLESGRCMAEAGHSRPASGAEHHYSHFWEMRLLREGRPPILHGLKVAIGTLETARLWDRIRVLSPARAAEALARASLPPRDQEEARILAAFGDQAEEVLANQGAFRTMGGPEFEELKMRILSGWEKIQGYASRVPSLAESKRLLAIAGCPTEAQDLGLGAEEIELCLKNAHYLRGRFTVKKLALMLGID